MASVTRTLPCGGILAAVREGSFPRTLKFFRFPGPLARQCRRQNERSPLVERQSQQPERLWPDILGEETVDSVDDKVKLEPVRGEGVPTREQKEHHGHREVE